MDYRFTDDEREQVDIPEVNFAMSVQPYMYEPVIQRITGAESHELDVTDDEESHSSTSDVEDESEKLDMSTARRLQNISWCKCQNCSLMPTVQESKCCQETNIIDGKIEEAAITCITHHEGFVANCLNIYVLETSYYEYLQENGPFDPSQMIHENYRYLAYRRFTRWIYRVLGKHRRVVLPSCVVGKIRKQFPAEQYTGFKYPK
ncbi:P2X purinoceptor 7-like [Mytilus galloprovincialis]|uniref:P2X purinoceptor 7-like n=1 Tax=Mytilus galloprovincialis TaxID=29158 RepID=UPI003F7C3B33